MYFVYKNHQHRVKNNNAIFREIVKYTIVFTTKIHMTIMYKITYIMVRGSYTLP